MTIIFANKLSNLLTRLRGLHRFRFPTLLGLGLVLVGIGLGVYLVNQKQGLSAQAAPDQTPHDIILSNIEDTQVTISWQTSSPTTSVVTYGINSSNEFTSLDDQDKDVPQPQTTHFFTIKDLAPQTSYQYKIIFGKSSTDISKFSTAKMATNQNNLKPIIGTVLEKNQPLPSGIVYLATSGAITQSALVKNGNFIIPISMMRQDNLEAIFAPVQDTQSKLTIISSTGTATALINLTSSELSRPISIGDNVDLALPSPTPTPTLNQNPDLLKYDLNNDGQVSTQDYAIMLKNYGKNPTEKRADLNGDGVVEQKDLTEMSKKINELKR